MSQSRKPIAPEFGIHYPRDNFSPPPCQPPCGKDVLERFVRILNSQPANQKDVKYVAYLIAQELDELWRLGDARIPRMQVRHIQNKIMGFYDQLKLLKKKIKAKQPKYISTVSERVVG